MFFLKNIVLIRNLLIAGAFIMIMFFIIFDVHAEDYYQPHRILILHSYQEALVWDRHINDGIEGVIKNSNLNYDLFYEYMDSKRGNITEYFKKLAEFYRYKYRKEKFDIIIASDNNALLFLEKYREAIFPDTPIIFTGINGYKPKLLDNQKEITGIAEILSYKDTIEIALKLHPDRSNIIVYGDDTTTYRINKSELEKLTPEYGDNINFIFKESLTGTDIKKDLAEQSENSIVLLISTISDDRGRTLSSPRIAGLLSKANKKIPVYGLWDFFLGHGVLGGKVVNGRIMGKLAAEMAVKYLKGANFSDLEVVKDSSNQYMFDYNQLNRFGIKINSLPENSIIVNKPGNSYRIKKEYIVSGIFIGMVMFFVIVYLSNTNRKLKKTKKDLNTEKVFSERIINTAEALIVVMDLNGEIRLFNKFSEKLSLYKSEEVLGKNVSDIFFSKNEKTGYKEQLSEILNNDVNQWEDKTTIYDKGGGEHLISWHNSLIKNADNQVEGILSIGIDLTEKQRIEENLQYKLYHDELTSLPNMKFIRERLSFELERHFNQDRHIAIMMFDLDRFRLVNDIYGHKFGDQLLIMVSERLTSLLGDIATLARIGGDDFIIMFTDISEIPDIVNIAGQILDGVKRPFEINGEELLIQASIGIAVFPGDGGNEDLLIKAADSALYRAKEMENISYQLYNNDINIRNIERHFLEKNLPLAIEEKQFMVYYQPVINLRTGQIGGAEALIRWNHPQKGFISPGKFIPIAEENGSILTIGDYVIRQAVADFKEWYRKGYKAGILSVNLSPRQFSQSGLTNKIASILKDCDFPYNKLALEITETTAINNPALTARTLYELRDKDIKVLLDDFGTGFSSFNYLTRFPVNGLKIDGSFINLLEKKGENMMIVAAIIAMAHELGIRVVAEGVETKEQLNFLMEYNCDYSQGYYYYHPMPAKDFEQLLIKMSNYV